MKNFVFVSFLLILFFSISCKKDNNSDDGTDLPFKYDTLYADPDTFAPLGQTQLYAVATGSNLTYTWTATLGNFVGSSSSVIYIATPCMIGGQYDVTCKVNDSKGNEQARTCIITIQ